MRGYLTDAELQKIMKKKFPTKRLEQVRDVFLFSCYTGLSYVDVKEKELKASDIRISFDGKPWIMTHRHKTDTPVNVPLLKIPQAILQKYESQLPKGQLLPVLSNQKLNSYLKEIADLCGIKKNITFHLARHITLSKPAGFSILQCSASIKRTLFSFAKVVFFFLIAKVIPLKNRENQTSYHYCTFAAHLADENQ